MRKFILIIALLISVVGLNAQNVGDNTIIDYEGYSLQFTITNIEPAECKVSGYTDSPTEVTIPSTASISGTEFNVTSIGDHAFSDYSSLTSIEIPNSVTSIEAWAFDGCSSLTSVTFGENSQLTSIGDNAFYGCESLTSIEIPNSVTSIEGGAFAFCSSLTSIVVAEGNIVYDSRENCNAIIETSSNTLIAGCQNTVIPNSVTSIGDYAFIGSSLTSIEIPNSVTSIGDYVFNFCSDLESIVVEAGNTVYDSRNNCNAIIETSTNKLLYGCVNTVIPSDVTSIEDYAFVGKNNITTIIIPDNVISIGGHTFYECLNLESIVFEENSKLERFEDGNLGGCFHNCKELKSITIPKSVKYIGRGTFKASGLENIVFEEGSKLDTIGYLAFSECSSLTSIEIPNSVTSIGSSAFSDCSSLTSIVVAEGNTVYDSRENCNAIIETSSNKLIAGCQNTVIPNSVTSIGNSAFYYCSSLTNIEIPNSVTSIGSWAFSDCSSLTSIICHAENVPETGSSVFYNCPSDMIIYVPINSVALYQATEPWNNYNIVAIPEIGNNSIIDYEGYSLQFTITSVEPAECEVSGYLGEPTAITIPSSIEIEGIEFSVTSIKGTLNYTGKGGAFEDCSSLTSVEIPNSVTSIGDWAFFGCSSLINITFGDNSQLTSIGNNAFYECSNLTSIEIPNSVTSIGDYVFTWCSSITSLAVADGNTIYDSRDNCNAIIETSSNTLIAGCQNTVIPNSITVIGDGAFGGRSNMTSIEIPNSVTSIENNAFGGCLGMENIEIPNSVTEIGMWAFWNCSSLASIEIPNSVTFIGNLVFENCSSLTSIVVADGNTVYDSRENCNAIIETSSNTLTAGCQNTVIPNSVTEIGYGAFRGCSNLTSIEIPNSVTEIGMLAWDGCSSLTSIICHAENVPETESSAFDNCPSDMIIYVPINSVALYQATEPWNNYNIVGNNSIIDYDGYSLKFEITSVEPAECEVSGYLGEPTAITIPSSIEIEGIEFSVTSIKGRLNYTEKGGAFEDCSSLTSVEIPNSVTSIGHAAFSRCSSLINITFGDNSQLTSIGVHAFSFTAIASIEIPNSVTSIGDYVFNFCSDLESIVVEAGNTVYDSRNNCNAIIETSTNKLLYGCVNTVIPSDVTSIEDQAFAGKNNITTIIIPDNVISIGGHAFYECLNLESIVFEENSKLERFEDGNVWGCFYNCKELKSITIPKSVKYIGRETFKASGLENIVFEEGSKLDTIGYEAFSYCSSLTSIEIPNTVNSIRATAFSECSSLTSIVVAEGNTVYDSRENCNAIIETSSNKLIAGCQNTVIPNSVTSIGDWAFSYCSSLTSIEIPNSVTSIGNYAFYYCSSLTSIICHAENVPETESSAFNGCPSDMIIYVPINSVPLYQAAEPWNNYNLITGLEFEVDVLKNIEEAGTISGTGTYTDGETVTLTAVPNEGYKFVYWSHNGTVLSADTEYSFTVTSDMVIEANFLTPNHWTPDPTIYPNNMTIIADVKIDGRDLLQRNIIFKLYDSYGDGWNGCSLTIEFSDGTPSQDLTVHSGSSAVHTLTAYSDIINVSFNQGSWPEDCSFTIEYEDGELIYQSSGTPNAGHVCEFKTLGYSPLNIELGAFCGEELRGTSRSQYIESPVDGFEFFLLLYGNDSDEITFKLYDHETDSVLNLATQERIDFVSNSTIGIMSDPKIINFTSRVSVTAVAEIAEAGTVTGGGMYHIGETITLTATSNEGFVFKNWTLNNEVVSEESEYTFIVTSEAEYKANYHYRQERQLTKGWNWYSTYINNEGIEGLYAMEEGLGSVGLQIKSQNDFVSYEDGSWYGTMNKVSNDEMYMIKLSRAKKLEMIGEKVDLSECPITLGTNWKWISYPLKQPMNVGLAFSGITPNTGDYIKSQTSFAQYDEELGWRGTLNSMIPGEGYMYYNTSGYAKTLVYPEANAKTEIEDNITSDYNHWIADMTMYPANMNIIATVDNNSDNNFEVAAFCDGECRGSARPIYIEELNANIIFLTVCGDNNETISFRYYDIDSEKEYDIVNTLTFGMNDITGSMREPYIMSFIPADVDEVSLSGINIYPNPADINDEINLGAECERVEIYNSLGVKVSEYENVNHIDGIETAGIYVIKIINKGTIKYDRIIVR